MARTDLDADLAIVGGGVSGIALAERLARQAGHRERILLLDADETRADPRLWCFWSGDDHEHEGMVRHRWDRWRVATPVEDRMSSVRGLHLQAMNAQDWFDRAEAYISRSAIRVERGVRANAVRSVDGAVELDTPFGMLRAARAVDTRPISPRALGRATLIQAQAGATIRAARPIFDPACADLMTGMTGDEAGFGFTSFLPLDAQTAHVEYTRLSAAPLPAAEMAARLDEAVALALDGTGYEVLRRERAVLPLGLNRRRPKHPRLIAEARMGGGGLRAATGQGFLRAQGWAEACADSWISGGPLISMREPFWTRRLDMVFLRAIRAHPENAADYMMALARALSPRAFVRFLTQEARLYDHARAALALPKRRLMAAAPAALAGVQPRLRLASA